MLKTEERTQMIRTHSRRKCHIIPVLKPFIQLLEHKGRQAYDFSQVQNSTRHTRPMGYEMRLKSIGWDISGVPWSSQTI